MRNNFNQYLHALIDEGDISLVNDGLSMPHFWNDLASISSAEKYNLIHAILTAMPAGMDDQSDEAQPYVESVVFLMMSIPYEACLFNEEKMAIKVTEDLLKRDLKADVSKVDSLRKFAHDLQSSMNIKDGVNLGLRFANNNTSPHVLKMFNGNAAVYCAVPLSLLQDEFTIECPDIHPTSILLNGEEIVNRSVEDLALWTAHEMVHHHQRFMNFPEVEAQKSNALAKRINRLMPRTAYYSLMEERQAYAFEGWISDSMNKNQLRSEMQIACDNLWFKGKLSGDLIDKIHEYHNFIQEISLKQSPELLMAI